MCNVILHVHVALSTPHYVSVSSPLPTAACVYKEIACYNESLDFTF